MAFICDWSMIHRMAGNKLEAKQSEIYNGDIFIHQSENCLIRIDMRLAQETIWLIQQQVCELYQTSKSNVSEHIEHIFEEGEMNPNAVIARKFLTTTQPWRKYREKAVS